MKPAYLFISRFIGANNHRASKAQAKRHDLALINIKVQMLTGFGSLMCTARIIKSRCGSIGGGDFG